jgi:chaperone BCS1
MNHNSGGISMEVLEQIIQEKSINTDMILTMIISLYGITIVMFLFKSIPDKIINFLLYHFTTKISIFSMDKCYYSLIKLFQKDNLVDRARNLRLINGHYGYSDNIDKSIGPGTHYFFYKHKPIKIHYKIEQTQYSDEKIHITMTKFGRSHKLFDELLVDLQTLIKIDNKVNELAIHSYNPEDARWRLETHILKRNFNTIFIEDSIKNRLLNHLDNFYASEDWYHERGIPYQTGICLHGPAGTGKTSIVKGLASHYNKGLCILRSSEIDKLPHALKQLPSDSFVVIEDIDTSSIVVEREPNETLENSLYRLGKNKNNAKDSVEAEVPVADVTAPPKKKNNTEKTENKIDISSSYSKVYLSDVLNAMDGLISIEKRVIIFTTNHLEKLDRALIRPGRIDCLERIDYISYTQFKRFCYLFYKTTITDEEKDILENKYSSFKCVVTVAELQRNFMQGMKLKEMIETYCK